MFHCQCFEQHKHSSIHLNWIGVEAEITDISKSAKNNQKYMHWTLLEVEENMSFCVGEQNKTKTISGTCLLDLCGKTQPKVKGNAYSWVSADQVSLSSIFLGFIDKMSGHKGGLESLSWRCWNQTLTWDFSKGWMRGVNKKSGGG